MALYIPAVELTGAKDFEVAASYAFNREAAGALRAYQIRVTLIHAPNPNYGPSEPVALWLERKVGDARVLKHGAQITQDSLRNILEYAQWQHPYEVNGLLATAYTYVDDRIAGIEVNNTARSSDPLENDLIRMLFPEGWGWDKVLRAQESVARQEGRLF